MTSSKRIRKIHVDLYFTIGSDVISGCDAAAPPAWLGKVK